MPLASVTFGSGALGEDAVPPALSKNYTYQNVVDLVRVLSHASGNTTVLTDAEIFAIVNYHVSQIAKENYQQLQPCYLQSATLTINNVQSPYKSDFSTLNPFVDKFVGCIFLQGYLRTPISIVDSQQLQDIIGMPTIYVSSIAGTFNDLSIELFVGTEVVTNPYDYYVEMYYYRQAKNDSVIADYVDLPDNMIPDVVDRSVLQLDRTKD